MSVTDDRDRAAAAHATRMFAWEEQIAEDPSGRRQATANRVARLIRKRVDARTGRAAGDWVEQKRLAKELGVSRYGLQKALYWLQDRGHLLIHSGKIWRVADEYEPILRAATMPTAVGSAPRPELASEANPSWHPKPTGVGTSNHFSSSKFSGRPPELDHETAVRRQDSVGRRAPDFRSRRDDFSCATSELKARVAADQDSEEGGIDDVRLPSAVGRR